MPLLPLQQYLVYLKLKRPTTNFTLFKKLLDTALVLQPKTLMVSKFTPVNLHHLEWDNASYLVHLTVRDTSMTMNYLVADKRFMFKLQHTIAHSKVDFQNWWDSSLQVHYMRMNCWLMLKLLVLLNNKEECHQWRLETQTKLILTLAAILFPTVLFPFLFSTTKKLLQSMILTCLAALTSTMLMDTLSQLILPTPQLNIFLMILETQSVRHSNLPLLKRQV